MVKVHNQKQIPEQKFAADCSKLKSPTQFSDDASKFNQRLSNNTGTNFEHTGGVDLI